MRIKPHIKAKIIIRGKTLSSDDISYPHVILSTKSLEDIRKHLSQTMLIIDFQDPYQRFFMSGCGWFSGTNDVYRIFHSKLKL